MESNLIKMRIIGGDLKGKKINYLSSSKTRPLRDFVKESIFNVLSHSNLINVKIFNANILDIYSGVGSFGIECISHGAKKVTFIEQDVAAQNILSKNLQNLSILKQSILFKKDVKSFLNAKPKMKFDIFFLDPPFSATDYLENLVLIKKLKLYKKRHLIIFHREVKKEDSYKQIIHQILTKEYGRSKIIFGYFK